MLRRQRNLNATHPRPPASPQMLSQSSSRFMESKRGLHGIGGARCVQSLGRGRTALGHSPLGLSWKGDCLPAQDVYVGADLPDMSSQDPRVGEASPSPQAALQRVPTSFPSFSLPSYRNSPPQIFSGHGPHQGDGIVFLYTPKDNAEGTLICEGGENEIAHRDSNVSLKDVSLKPLKKDSPQMQPVAHPEPLAEGWLLHCRATLVSYTLGLRIPPWVEGQG